MENYQIKQTQKEIAKATLHNVDIFCERDLKLTKAWIKDVTKNECDLHIIPNSFTIQSSETFNIEIRPTVDNGRFKVTIFEKVSGKEIVPILS